MKPSAFAYSRAESLEHALQVLADDEDARILAGGQSLLPLMNLRLARPSHLVDVGDLDSLAGVVREPSRLLIGALTRHRELETSELVAEAAPLLRAGIREVGHIAIRNRGTVGGSLAHADPVAELPLLMVVLDAVLVVESLAMGRREIAASDFFQAMFTTALAPDEVLTQILVPTSSGSAGWGFREYARRPGDFAIAGAAALVKADARGAVTSVRGGVLGASDVPTLVGDLAPMSEGGDRRAHWDNVVRRSSAAWPGLGSEAEYAIALAHSALVDALVEAELRAVAGANRRGEA